MLRIGEVAARSRVGIETIRYYERQGLIDAPLRSASGYRQYSEDVVDRIDFYQKARMLGFSLGESRELLELRVNTVIESADVKRKAVAKIEDLKSKIGALESMKNSLEVLVYRCNDTEPIGQCPILSSCDKKRD